MTIAATPYPLVWPPGWPREAYRTYAARQVSDLSIAESRDRLFRQLDHMRADRVVLSTNLPINTRGEPRGDAPNPSDPGVALYFYRKGVQLCFTRDKYTKVATNIWSLAKGLEYLRGLERHGGSHLMERAFSGFVAALPMPRIRDWREVLEAPYATTLEEARVAYRSAALKHHPDHGGSADDMSAVNNAWEQAQREFLPHS